MKKLILLFLVLFPALTFAVKPTPQPDSPPPLKALWNDVLQTGPTTVWTKTSSISALSS